MSIIFVPFEIWWQEQKENGKVMDHISNSLSPSTHDNEYERWAVRKHKNPYYSLQRWLQFFSNFIHSHNFLKIAIKYQQLHMLCCCVVVGEPFGFKHNFLLSANVFKCNYSRHCCRRRLLCSSVVFNALNIGYMAVKFCSFIGKHMSSWALQKRKTTACCGVGQLNSLGTYSFYTTIIHTYLFELESQYRSCLSFFIRINCDFVCWTISRVTDTRTTHVLLHNIN